MGARTLVGLLLFASIMARTDAQNGTVQIASTDRSLTNSGPIITNVTHTPAVPHENEELCVTAKVSFTANPVRSVSLTYRIMFSNEVTVPMHDDGLNGDGSASDGVYGATIPTSGVSAGQMIRYFLTAIDSDTNQTRDPLYLNSTNGPQYYGTMIFVAQTNGLPLLHLFIPPTDLMLVNRGSAARCSLMYLDQFYDNVELSRHGQSSASFPKKSYNLKFNRSHRFQWKDGESRVSGVNLLTTYSDKAHIRNILAYEGTYRAAGAPYHFVEHVRVHTNGGFFGDWHMVEKGNEGFLERLGLDPKGALYKMYAPFTDISQATISKNANADKKTRRYESNADLVALFNGVSPTVNTTAMGRATYLWDNINVPEVVNVMAARVVTGDIDCCGKNYYFYLDTEKTGEWLAIPWDVDLSFGRKATSVNTYWDDAMFPNTSIDVGANNYFFQLVLGSGPAAATGFPQSRQMFLRRLRTLLDDIIQSTNTPPSERHYEKMISEHYPKMIADTTLDLLKWGTWGHGSALIARTDGSYLTVTEAVQQLRDYLDNRRNALIHAKTALGAMEIPPPQPTNVFIGIGATEFNPGSPDHAQDYVHVINTNDICVDISGWKLSGAVDFTFPAGTVIVSNSFMYVSPNVKAFRQRATFPKGEERLLVVGPYKRQLSAHRQTVALADRSGRAVTMSH